MAATQFLIIICGVTPVNIAYVPCFQEHNTPFLNSLEDGMALLEKSKGGDFAIAVGLPKAKYHVSLPPCELMLLGNFRSFYDAMVVRAKSGLKAKFDDAMTIMQKNGDMNRLTNKWFDTTCEVSGADPASVATLCIIIIGIFLSSNSLFVL